MGPVFPFFTQTISLPSNPFVSQSGWRCPALPLSSNDLSPHIAVYLSPRLADGVHLSSHIVFICFPVWLSMYVIVCIYVYIPVVPHKAVAEVSKNLVLPHAN